MKKIFSSILVFALLCNLCILNIAKAETDTLDIPDLISDNALFQQGEPIKIWGSTTADSPTVTATLKDGEEVISTGELENAPADFNFEIPAVTAGGPYTLTITDGTDTEVFDNILIGELWVSSGQSNMELRVSSCGDYKNEMYDYNEDDDIRIFVTPDLINISSFSDITTEQRSLTGYWSTPTKEIINEYSAVAWCAINELYKQLGGCPVGSICVARRGSQMSGLSAGGFYNYAIAPVSNMNIKGIFWYQGEAHWTHSTETFLNQFNSLIEKFRANWGEDTPFIATQLPASPGTYQPSADDPETATFVDFTQIRYNQLQAVYAYNDGLTSIISAMDATPVGDSMHGQNKKPIGKHLAQEAMAVAYGTDVYRGVMYTGYSVVGNELTVNFANTYDGLTTTDGKAPRGFTVAGSDRVYYEATAVISEDKKSVVLTSSNVETPIYFRCCDDTNLTDIATTSVLDGAYIDVNLVNSAGLPAIACASDVYYDKDYYVPEVGTACEIKPSEIKPAYTVARVSTTTTVGGNASLPETVTLTDKDGTSSEKTVSWSKVDTSEAGTVLAYGVVDDTTVVAVATVDVGDTVGFVGSANIADNETNVSADNLLRFILNNTITTAEAKKLTVTVKENGNVIDTDVEYFAGSHSMTIDFDKTNGSKYTVTIAKEDGTSYTMSYKTAVVNAYEENFDTVEVTTFTKSTWNDVDTRVKVNPNNATTGIEAESETDNCFVMKVPETNASATAQYQFNASYRPDMSGKNTISFNAELAEQDATNGGNLGIQLYMLNTAAKVNNSQQANIGIIYRAGGNIDLQCYTYNGSTWSSGTLTASKKWAADTPYNIDLVIDQDAQQVHLYIDGEYQGAKAVTIEDDDELSKINFNMWGKSSTAEFAQSVYCDDIVIGRTQAAVHATNSIYPSNGTTMASNESAVITFADGVLGDTLSSIRVTDKDGNEATHTSTFDILNNKYSMAIPGMSVGEEYTITTAGLMDSYGEAINLTSTFTVAAYKQDFDNLAYETLQTTAGSTTTFDNAIKVDTRGNTITIKSESDGSENKVMIVPIGEAQFNFNSGYRPELTGKKVISFDVTLGQENTRAGNVQFSLISSSTTANSSAKQYDAAVVFSQNGAITLRGYAAGVTTSGGNTNVTASTTWSKDAKMHIDLIMDISAQKAYLYINETLAAQNVITVTDGAALYQFRINSWGLTEKENVVLDNLSISNVAAARVAILNGTSTISKLENITSTKDLTLKFTGFDTNIKLIFALYDTDGRFIDCAVKDITEVSAKYPCEPVSFGFSDTHDIAENTNVVKAFMWNNDTIAPLGDVVMAD